MFVLNLLIQLDQGARGDQKLPINKTDIDNICLLLRPKSKLEIESCHLSFFASMIHPPKPFQTEAKPEGVY
jgi:hypothetical protein